MKIYKCLYYNLFCIWQKKTDEPENAHINAVLTITFLIYTNIMSIPLSYLALTGKEILNIPEITFNVKVWIIILLVLTGILNYFLLASKKQHNKIIQENIGQDEDKRKLGMLFTTIYIVISFAIPLYIFFFTNPK